MFDFSQNQNENSTRSIHLRTDLFSDISPVGKLITNFSESNLKVVRDEAKRRACNCLIVRYVESIYNFPHP